MTGQTMGGHSVHQREKVFAMILLEPLSAYEVTGKCWKTDDPVIKNIKQPTVRRILQELRDSNPKRAIESSSGKYVGVRVAINA